MGSFTENPTFAPYSSNRGMTLDPNGRYNEMTNFLSPKPYNWHEAAYGSQSQNQGGQTQWPDLLGSMGLSGLFGGGQSQPQGGKIWKPMANPRSGGGRGYAGGTIPPTSTIPPVYTNPQVPVNNPGQGSQNPLGGLGSFNNPITAGLLPQSQIDQASQGLLASMGRNVSLPGQIPGMAGRSLKGNGQGLFGTLMSQQGQVANTNLLRDAAQQQAEMQNQYDAARSGVGLQQMGLLSALNRENVTNDVAQRNAIINLLSAMLGGLG